MTQGETPGGLRNMRGHISQGYALRGSTQPALSATGKFYFEIWSE
ncbi:hypothetical protein [Roseicyclus sp.]